MNIKVNEGFRIVKCAWQVLEYILQVLLTSKNPVWWFTGIYEIESKKKLPVSQILNYLTVCGYVYAIIVCLKLPFCEIINTLMLFDVFLLCLVQVVDKWCEFSGFNGGWCSGDGPVGSYTM